ncbi:fatty-acid amide hydrolase 2-like [Ornithodoros turicata]|uniref:fatty-acid amide hydrolase 2-like n=1 Tax=Ornithodoros turicata TaxID=34597 RepID=UPI00313A2464
MGSLVAEIYLFVQELFLFLYDRVVHFVFGLWYSRFPKATVPPTNNPLLCEPATSLADKIRAGKVKSVNVVQAHIDRIKDVQPLLNAIVDERFEAALAEAEEIDRKVSSSAEDSEFLKKPLLGVPFTVKNYVAVKDCLWDTGSWYHKGRKASEDAKTVQLLREAGAVPLAITNVPELTISVDNMNRVYGRTSNPYDTNRMPGGSSGGEGALLASQASLLGLGTDIGGSVRVPAASCGIFSHKPSGEIVSVDGLPPDVGQGLSTLNTIGPMTRYVEDLLPMFKVLAGPQGTGRLRLDEQVNLKDLNIYHMPDDGAKYITRVESQMSAAVYKAVSYLETVCGSKSTQVSLPELREATATWVGNILAQGTSRFSKELKAGKGSLNYMQELLLTAIGKSKHNMASIMFVRQETRSEKYAQEYVEKAKAFGERLERLLGDNGILVLPTNSSPAPYHNEWLTRWEYFFGFTCLFNVVRVPVTVAPIMRGEKDRMPIGVQIVASRNNDRLGLAAAKELSKAFGGWTAPGR